MNEILVGLLVAFALVLGVLGWARHRARRRQQHLRKLGYDLIASLKAYSAWVDCQLDEPFPSEESVELPLPQPLARVQTLKEAAFPELSHHMVRLLQAHSRLVEYFWQRNLLRLSQAVGWRPAYQDPQYQQIRGAQEDLIQEMIGLCQEAIGDRAQEWRRTGTDFSFSSSDASTMPPV